jgi:hypothetical protein
MGSYWSAFKVRIKRFFKLNKWSDDRPGLVKSRDDLNSNINKLQLQESALTTRSTTKKQEINLLVDNVKRRNPNGGGTPTHDEITTTENLLAQVAEIDNERKTITNTIKLLRSKAARIHTIIIQNDAVHNMATSMKTVDGADINLEELDQTLDRVEATSNRLISVTDAVSDRFEAAVNLNEKTNQSYTNVTAQSIFAAAGLPFMDQQQTSTPIPSFTIDDSASSESTSETQPLLSSSTHAGAPSVSTQISDKKMYS